MEDEKNSDTGTAQGGSPSANGESASNGAAGSPGSPGGPNRSAQWLAAAALIAVLAGALIWHAHSRQPVASPPPPQESTEPEHKGPWKPVSATYTHPAMGTEFSFTLYSREGDEGTDAIQQIADEAFRAVDALEDRVSRFRPDSQTTYLNNHAAKEPVRVAPDIRDLLVFSRRVYDETGGAFDVTVGPLIELWGFYKGEGRLPADAELQAALSAVGMDKVRVAEKDRTVRFTEKGVQVDFGGVAKGLALDHAAQVLMDYGVTSALLHAGTSTVVAIGTPPGEPGWKVRIRNPYNKVEYVDEVVLSDESLSTSGNYEKFFELNGKKYCHIFDPRTGKPVEGMLSATVIAPAGMESDALSTAFFVMGEERCRAYCEAHPGIRAILVPLTDDGKAAARRISFPAEKEQP